MQSSLRLVLGLVGAVVVATTGCSSPDPAPAPAKGDGGGGGHADSGGGGAVDSGADGAADSGAGIDSGGTDGAGSCSSLDCLDDSHAIQVCNIRQMPAACQQATDTVVAHCPTDMLVGCCLGGCAGTCYYAGATNGNAQECAAVGGTWSATPP
jgi:hypothetical protein